MMIASAFPFYGWGLPWVRLGITCDPSARLACLPLPCGGFVAPRPPSPYPVFVY
uniref:Uncharacterized protein n=1 Tax=Rhizophora mucronata TaxID=61149 RepID=A0A2P2PWX5_RHIMU